MTKEKLLQELKQETFVTLKASPVHGIGVFAICDIPKGCRSIFSKQENEWTKLSFKEVEALPYHSRQMIETYCLYDEAVYFVPYYGFKMMDMVLYLNHSDTPNLISINEGEFFEAARDIKAGEELFLNYKTIADGLESYEDPGK